MSNLEASFIKKLLVEKEYLVVIDKQITPKHLNGRYAAAFKYIREFYTQYAKVPGIKTFRKKFAQIPLPDSYEDETMQWYCDELREKTKHNMIVDTLEEMEGDMEELKSADAYNKLKKLILKIENEVNQSDNSVTNKNTESRMKAYLKRKNSGGMTGIPSFIDRLDWATKGFNDGELTTILGYTGTGKSWLKLIMAVLQAKAGYKVLFFTSEMAADMVQRRIDAIWALISYTNFRDGKLTDDEFERFQKYLEYVEGNDEVNLIVEHAHDGVSQVSAKIDQHEPDIVYVDGAYLLSDDQAEEGEDGWKNLVHIWRALHRLCLVKKLPIIVSTQSKERKISLSAISFAKAIAADCDLIIGLDQDDQMKEDREIKISFHKMREGALPSGIVMNWDFDKMDWSTIYAEGRDGFVEDQDEEDKDSRKQARDEVKAAGKNRIMNKPKPNTGKPKLKRPLRKRTKRSEEVPDSVQMLA